MTRGRQAIGLVVALALCFAAAALGGLLTREGVATWYPGIAKPDWTPPGWVFGPVWSVLYAAMAVAAWLVWRSASKRLPLVLFAIQLALNVTWSGLFFALRQPGWAFAEILVLWLAILATTASFYKGSKTAFWLMAPYLAWVTFAAVLNAAIWRLNLPA